MVLRQFQPGAVLTASVTDSDAVDTGNDNGLIFLMVTLLGSGTGRRPQIPNEDCREHTPLRTADVGMHIRAMATYSDGSGASGECETSHRRLRCRRSAGQSDNDAPVFASTTVGRRIAENSTGNRRRAGHGHGRQ